MRESESYRERERERATLEDPVRASTTAVMPNLNLPETEGTKLRPSTEMKAPRPQRPLPPAPIPDDDNGRNSPAG